MSSLTNKIVLITGATSGIGKACAHAFAQLGAKLLLCARSEDALTEIATTLKNTYHSNIYTFLLDVRNLDDIKKQFSSLPSEWKSIDLLINNAGLAAGLETLDNGNTDDWNAMIDTNLKGLLFVTRELLPSMIAKKSGHVINIGSIAGHQVYPNGNVYCATKFAVKALSDGLRMDLSGKNIRVTMISPGAVETNFSVVRFKGDKARADAFYKGWTPLQAEDVADAVIYAATRKPHINISEILVMPTDQAAMTMIHKKID